MITVDAHDRPSPGSGAWLPLMVLLGLAFAVAAGLYSSRTMVLHKPAAVTEVTAGNPGVALDVAAEVTDVSATGEVSARLLTRRGGVYARTTDHVEIHLKPGAKFVMGVRADLKPGAVLQVHGILESAEHKLLDAEQVVFLTGYVKVE